MIPYRLVNGYQRFHFCSSRESGGSTLPWNAGITYRTARCHDTDGIFFERFGPKLNSPNKILCKIPDTKFNLDAFSSFAYETWNGGHVYTPFSAFVSQLLVITTQSGALAVRWPEYEADHLHASFAPSYIFVHCTAYVAGVMVKHVGGNNGLIPYPPPSWNCGRIQVATWWCWRLVGPAAEGNQFPKKRTDTQPSQLKGGEREIEVEIIQNRKLCQLVPYPSRSSWVVLSAFVFHEGWKFFFAVETLV